MGAHNALHGLSVMNDKKERGGDKKQQVCMCRPIRARAYSIVNTFF